MNCTAYEKDGIWHLHGGNQWFSMAAPTAAAALGVEADKVFVISTWLEQVLEEEQSQITSY